MPVDVPVMRTVLSAMDVPPEMCGNGSPPQRRPMGAKHYAQYRFERPRATGPRRERTDRERGDPLPRVSLVDLDLGRTVGLVDGAGDPLRFSMVFGEGA